MAKQQGIILLKGTMGGISFYKRNGQHLARKAAGPDRSRIMNDPNFERTRENNTEFAGVQVSASAFSKIFHSVKNFKDVTFHGRLAKIQHGILKRANGTRGQRSIEISKNRELIRGLELNSNAALANSFHPPFKITHSNDRTKSTITLTNIEVKSAITAPPSATHFKLVQLLGVVSDVAYSLDIKKYVPLDTGNNSIHDIVMTDYLAVNDAAPLNISLNTKLSAVGLLHDHTNVIQCFGILFFTKTGTEYFPLTQGKAMKVVDVF
jgi:hypothetical protein